jgi:hypothetical protein
VVLVTLDTNILPVEALLAAVPPGKFEFSVVSVTDREVGAAAGLTAPSVVGRVVETAVWDESLWDSAVWGDSGDGDCFEKALAIVAAGSFPPPGQRARLTDGQRRQLRDAMIFCAHVRAGRHIFVSNDEKGFVREGRREQLEKAFATRIMTRNEFLAEFAS